MTIKFKKIHRHFCSSCTPKTRVICKEGVCSAAAACCASVQSADLAIPQPKGEEEEEQRKRGRCRSSGLRTQIICGLQVRGEGGGRWVQDAPGRVWIRALNDYWKHPAPSTGSASILNLLGDAQMRQRWVRRFRFRSSISASLLKLPLCCVCCFNDGIRMLTQSCWLDRLLLALFWKSLKLKLKVSMPTEDRIGWCVNFREYNHPLWTFQNGQMYCIKGHGAREYASRKGDLCRIPTLFLHRLSALKVEAR